MPSRLRRVGLLVLVMSAGQLAHAQAAPGGPVPGGLPACAILAEKQLQDALRDGVMVPAHQWRKFQEVIASINRRAKVCVG